jgi:hypothetical protein
VGEKFIGGPVPYAWISTACKLPGVGLHVVMAYRAHAAVATRKPLWSLESVAVGLRVSHHYARKSLHAAEKAGLVEMERSPGRKMAATFLDVPGNANMDPLKGPIPWKWWVPASRLPGTSLKVATLCWWLVGRDRSGTVELVPPDGWDGFGLSPDSYREGLIHLERAGLVSADRHRGRPPIVTILDPPG